MTTTMTKMTSGSGQGALLEEGGLGGHRAAEGSRGEAWTSGADTGLAAGESKKIGDLLGEDAFAFHPRPESWVIEPPPANRPDPVEHLIFSRGPVLGEPCFEEGSDRVWQPE